MIHTVSPEQAQQLISRGELDVVDVREVAEWERGHIPGARLVPLGELRADLAGSLPRDGILFICAAGVRSETAARLAASLGYQQLYNLAGGTRAWERAGLALTLDLEVRAA